MIRKEYFLTREDGIKLYHSYSDNNFYIQKVGTNEIYTDAIDVETATYEYVETEIEIEELLNPFLFNEIIESYNNKGW